MPDAKKYYLNSIFVSKISSFREIVEGMNDFHYFGWNCILFKTFNIMIMIIPLCRDMSTVDKESQ